MITSIIRLLNSVHSIGKAIRRLAVLMLPAMFAAPLWAEPVTSVIDNGPESNRVDMVFLGDGYTESEQDKFALDVQSAVDDYFRIEPYIDYASYFNVRRIEVISNDSGADHPEDNTFKDTAFDANYNCFNIVRLICVNVGKVNTVVSKSVTPDQADIIIVLVNDPQYGGSGGAIAVASTHPSASDLVIHEVGHSFGLLADEYDYGTCQTSGEPSELNVTVQTERERIKWNNNGGPPTGWIENFVSIPTVDSAPAQPGLYEGARYCTERVFRPTYDSAMRNLGKPFDQVNEELLVRRIYNWVSPLESSLPAEDSLQLAQGDDQIFTASAMQNGFETVSATWSVDDVVDGSGETYSLDTMSLSLGVHTVSVVVQDDTERVRNDPQSVLREERQWEVTITEGEDPEPRPLARVNIGSVEVSEGIGIASVPVTLSRAIDDTCSVRIFSRSATATPGADYYGAVESLTFMAGETEKAVNFVILDDATIEDTEIFTVVQGGFSGCEVGRDGQVTILDNDDGQGGQSVVNIADIQVAETDGIATVIVSLSNASDRECSVRVSTRADTATPGQDFYGSSEVLTFAAGDTEKSVSYQILNDTVDEENERFVVAQAALQGGCTAGTDGSVTIVD